MIRQDLKDIYFIANRWLAKCNAPVSWLWFRQPRHPEGHYLHLSCGDHYIQGMINADGNILRRKDLWLDLRNRLPFRAMSARVVYCCHVVEHLFPHEALRLMRDMRRVVGDDGVVRLAVPSLERAGRIMAGEDSSEWPRKFEDPTSQAINYLFCDGQHKYAYCWELMRTFLTDAGFRSIERVDDLRPREYGRVSLGNEPPGSLVVEARP